MSSFKKFRRKIKKSFWESIYTITDFRTNKNATITEKTLVIIKSDFIGDYILFRNFLPYIKQSEKYKDYKIILIGNIAWKNIAENLDSNYYDEMIWVSFDRLFKNLRYRSKTIKSILSKGYDTLFYPIYSDDTYTEDFLIPKIVAREKIKYISAATARKTAPFDKLLRSTQQNLFELYRQKEMFELFFDISITDFQLRDVVPDRNKPQSFTSKSYVVFFPGASTSLKRWSTKHFVDVAMYLLTNLSCDIVIAGSKKDKKIAASIITGTGTKNGSRFLDLTGKTSLVELATLINCSDLLITNDSAPIHIAAITNTKAVCVFMGENYGSFVPYPKDIYPNGRFICPPEIEIAKTNSATPGFLALAHKPDIDIISSDSVIAAAKELLTTKNNK
jgi:ADP-heptose:LPS heptosyltransferase